MPIEVRELVIRANVESENPRNKTVESNSTPTSPVGGGRSTSTYETLKKMIEDKNER